MKLKRLIKTIIFLIIMSSIILGNNSFADNSSDLQIYSEAAILIEKETGKVLYSKNIEKKMYPASTTKILTAIIAIEKLPLDEKITASYEAIMSIPSGYSNADIKVGETLTAKELLEVFLVHSANEAGFILAEHISGSVSNFADLMNEKAQNIGCKNTHFTNPSGLHDENHYTTAYDLALIAKYCMGNQTFRDFVSMESCTISPTNKHEERNFKNTNEMLSSNSKYYNENVIGIKTGYTTPAQNCLIASYKNDNIELISVVLGASASTGEQGLSGKYTDTQKLFDYGANTFSYKKIVSAGEVITQIPVKHAKSKDNLLDLIVENDIYTLIDNSTDISEINPEINLNQDIVAPIKENDVLGTITYNIDGLTYTDNLLAKNNIMENNFFGNLLKLVFAIIILFFIYKIMYPKKKKKSNYKFLYGRVKY